MTADILTVSRAEPAGPVPVLAAAGEIDSDSRAVLSDAAEAALRDGGNRLVIDLAAVSFCDSGGLSLFVDLHRLTLSRGGALRLARPQPAVMSVIYATNLDRLLQLDPTVEDAVRALTTA
jgi:anti-sigma B factor antagonist